MSAWFRIPSEFSHACTNGDVAQVQHFIALNLSADIYRCALAYASSWSDQPECVAQLIPLCDLKNDQSLLQSAAAVGSIKSLELLMGVCDPKINNSWALQAATANGCYSCMELLYPVSDVEAALTMLHHDFPDTEDAWSPLEEYHAQQIKTKLRNAIDGVQPTKLDPSRRM